MKTILFLAVLLFAAQSTPLHEIYRGFILNLPMNASTQNQFLRSGFDCLDSFGGVIINLVGSLQKDIPAKNYFDILRNLLVADDVLEHKIAPQCFVVYQELVQFFNQNRVVLQYPEWEDYCNTTLKRFSSWEERSKFYDDCQDAYTKAYSTYRSKETLITAKLLELSAHIVQDILQQQPFNLGERIAYIVKLANRMVKIDAEIVTRGDLYLPYNQEKFIFEFVPSFLEELGLSENKNQTILCLFDLFNTTMAALSHPNLERGDSLTATHAFLEGAMHVADSVQRCSQHLNLSRAERFVYIFTHYPGKALLKVFSNGLLNFTDYIAAQNNWRILMEHGDYIGSGKEYAKHVKIVLKDLVF